MIELAWIVLVSTFYFCAAGMIGLFTLVILVAVIAKAWREFMWHCKRWGI